MYQTINEKIDVIAIFGAGFQDVKPFKVKWGKREFIIKDIDYRHKLKQGDKVMHVFSCTDGTNFFEITFDANELKWILGRTWDGETT